MRDKFKDIYSMSTMKSIKQREQTIKYIIGTVLIIIAIILLIIIICINQNIKKISKTKLEETQVVASQQQEVKQSNEKAEIKKEEIKEANEIKENRLPEITEEGKERFATIFRSETKRAFLTFDDGPSTVTPTILQTLREKNVKATFFMLGSNAEKLPDMVKEVFKEGHYIANHGYSHIYETIYETPQSVLEEYNRTNDIIREIIGEPEFNSHLFRFPGGYAGGKYAEIKEQAKELLGQDGVLNIDWNCLTGDAEVSQPEQEYIMQRLQATSDGKNSIIVLMHDAQAKRTTADTLPQIIDYLAEQGYEFKTFYDIF